MVEALSLLIATETQWNWVGVGLGGAFRTGINYGVLPGIAASMDIKITPQVLADLKTMEFAAMAQWAKR